MSSSSTLETVRRKFELLRPLMNERLRRHWAACEALTLQRGGATLVAQATGLSRTTIWAGLRELRHAQAVPDADLPPQRSRHAGAGRPFLEQADPTLVKDLEALLEATSRGDPQSPLRWTCKSTRNLAAELNCQGHTVCYQTVCPWQLSSAAKFRVLLQVQRSGDCGSPREVASRRASRSLTKVGSACSRNGRPAPACRLRWGGRSASWTAWACRSSRRPAQMVVRDRPVAWATKVAPPRWRVRASQAAQ